MNVLPQRPFVALLSSVATGGFVGLFAVALGGSLWLGRQYYLLPEAERAGSELHPILSSGGTVGVALGFLGTAAMVAMLLYSARKALPRVRFLGPPSGWLTFHVICGVGGPLAIVLHAGLTWPEGLVAVAFWCMVAVALSGVFGRYVYGQLPRAEGGRALAWAAARAELTDLRARLVEQTADADLGAVGLAVALARDFGGDAATIPQLVRLGAAARKRRRGIKRALRALDVPPDVRADAERLLLRQLRLRQSLAASTVARRLFRYWHLFHRPLAGAMYAIVALHVASAILFGGSLARLSDLFAGR
jgi:hypothetical protein